MTALETLKGNTEALITEEELEQRLANGRPLRVKLGVDPTRPDLTLGHLVVFNKLRQFQDLGHEAILIIGDFTTLIGDPSGRSSTRPELSRSEIQANADTYMQQACKILDESRTQIRFNSEWFDKLTFEDALKLARQMTVARMLERDDFSKRHREHAPISIIEFLYPLVQGYDSLVLEADVEIGGNDQFFNILVGRTVLRNAGLPEQVVLTVPLLVGLDGVKKMSKSEDNYIAFNDSPKEMFGKIMSISDEAMWDYYRLLLETAPSRIEELKALHPMEVKKQLARALTARLHSPTDAERELAQFEQVFTRRQAPAEMPSYAWNTLAGGEPSARLLDLLDRSGLFSSRKEIRRLIEQGAVRVENVRMSDPHGSVSKPESSLVLQAGKRKFVRIEG